MEKWLYWSTGPFENGLIENTKDHLYILSSKDTVFLRHRPCLWAFSSSLSSYANSTLNIITLRNRQRRYAVIATSTRLAINVVEQWFERYLTRPHSTKPFQNYLQCTKLKNPLPFGALLEYFSI